MALELLTPFLAPGDFTWFSPWPLLQALALVVAALVALALGLFAFVVSKYGVRVTRSRPIGKHISILTPARANAGACRRTTSGRAVASLAGPLRWAVDVGYGGSVRIERRPPPGPVPSAEEVAAAVAWNEANYQNLPLMVSSDSD